MNKKVISAVMLHILFYSFPTLLVGIFLGMERLQSSHSWGQMKQWGLQSLSKWLLLETLLRFNSVLL